MAVSLSTGGSGYTRSDFMISDAAMPIRIEEAAAQADQSERFSQVLSGIGGADKSQDAPTEEAVKLMKDFIGDDGRVDFHRLAKAVAEGEVSLEEVPEEYMTGALFEELTRLIQKPESSDEDAKEFSDNPAVREMMSELAAMFTAQQSVRPDEISDKSAELSQLSSISPLSQASQVSVQPVTEQAQSKEVPQQVQNAEIPRQAQSGEIPQQVQDVEIPRQAQNEETVQPSEAVIQTEALAEEIPQQPVQAKSENPVVQESSEQVSQTVAEVQAAAADSGNANQRSGQDGADYSGQNSGNQPGLAAEAVKQTPETEQAVPAEVKQSITEFTVTKQEKPAENAQEALPEESVTFADRTAQRGRVVSKSDEIEMIKGADAAKAAPVQPQTAQTERPVVFTRADGGRVSVKPSEIVKQIADKIIERAADIKEGTEEYSVTLNPEDLGRITVKMTKTADGAVSVSIAAENSRTLRIIEENGTHIQDSLKQNGVQLESWQTVSESKQDAHAQDYQGSSKNPYRESENNRQEQNPDDESFAEIIASM